MGNYSMDLKNKIKQTKLTLDSLSVYRQLLDSPAITRVHKLLDYLCSETIEADKFINYYCDFYFILISNSSGSLSEYIIDCILLDENPFSKGIDSNIPEDRIYLLEGAAVNDLKNLKLVSDLSSKHIKEYASNCVNASELELSMISTLPDWENQTNEHSFTEKESPAAAIKKKFNKESEWSACIKDLKVYHKEYGTGIFAQFKAFKWASSRDRKGFKYITNPDEVRLSDLIGYESEREEIIKNTQNFLKGYPANNVLLYGDRGTGKSSTVKALANEYCKQGLRIIEVPKSCLIDFTEIVEDLRNRSQKFIIFVDDLAFEDNEDSYTALKAMLEGGVEYRPQNVLVYATSNRRHLVKEKFSDRMGLQSMNSEEEVNAADTIQEKLSLSDRFGINIVFSSPDKKRYLNIVEGLAANRGLKIDKEYLHKEALKWELWYNGRSPRTAKQFVDWLEANLKG